MEMRETMGGRRKENRRRKQVPEVTNAAGRILSHLAQSLLVELQVVKRSQLGKL